MTGKNLKNKAFFALCTILLAWAAVFAAPAKEIYYYKDSDGVLHFTDAPTHSRFQPVHFLWGWSGARLARIDKARFKQHIEAAAEKYDIEAALIKAVIRAESSFDPEAVSRAGAQGLMQLMPSTAREMEVQDTFDPQDNIFGGTRYLSYLLKRYNGDVKRAVAAYNLGPERVKAGHPIPNVPETQTFLARVMKYYNEYKTSE